VPETLGKAHITLGKDFAEYGTRQSIQGENSDDKKVFAECLFSDNQQNFDCVQKNHLAK